MGQAKNSRPARTATSRPPPDVEVEVDLLVDDAEELDLDVGEVGTSPLVLDVAAEAEAAAEVEVEPVPDELAEREVQLPAVVGRRRELPESLSALNVYLARLKDVVILPIEEQTQLAERYQLDGDAEAAARLVASNLRLVVKIAFQFRRQWADVMDLIAEGNVGLAEAIRKFDAERGVPFPSYARFWIRARILAFIQENAELAPSLDQRPVSLDVPAHGAEDGRTRGDALASDSFADPETAAGGGEVHRMLQESFAAFRETLDERDQAIWDDRLQAIEPLRLEDLGNRFGVSKERVRQLEARIKKRLKVFLERELGEQVIVEALH